MGKLKRGSSACPSCLPYSFFVAWFDCRAGTSFLPSLPGHLHSEVSARTTFTACERRWVHFKIFQFRAPIPLLFIVFHESALDAEPSCSIAKNNFGLEVIPWKVSVWPDCCFHYDLYKIINHLAGKGLIPSHYV